MTYVAQIKADSVGYKQERIYIALRYGDEAARRVQSCHVAHVKDHLRIVGRMAPNRIDSKARVKPCPPELWPMVEEAVRHVHGLHG